MLLVMAAVLPSYTVTHSTQRYFQSCRSQPLNFYVYNSPTRTLLTYNVWVAYHPPSSSQASGTSSNFYAELEQLCIKASISVIPTVIVVISTFILTIIIKSEPLRTLLESFNLTQHIHLPMHQTGHILDLVVSHTDDNFITSVTVQPDSLSDHHPTELTLSALKPAVKTALIAKLIS